MKLLKFINILYCMLLFAYKGSAQGYTKEVEQRGESLIAAKPIDKAHYAEVKYRPKVIGQTDNLVAFELVGTGIPIVLYTYTDDYLAFLEINNTFIPFFDGYLRCINDNVFESLDGIKILKKDNEYIIIFPAITHEFTTFQLIGFDENASYKDYGFHTYDYETFKKILGTPYEEQVFYVKTYLNNPRVYVRLKNEDFLLSDIHYRPQEHYAKPSEFEEIKHLRQLKGQ